MSDPDQEADGHGAVCSVGHATVQRKKIIFSQICFHLDKKRIHAVQNRNPCLTKTWGSSPLSLSKAPSAAGNLNAFCIVLFPYCSSFFFFPAFIRVSSVRIQLI